MAENDHDLGSEPARMSMRAYARARGVSLSVIQHARRTGLIRLGPDGLIDRRQADSGWGAMHSRRPEDYYAATERERKIVQARISEVVGKLRLDRDRLERLQAQLVDRKEAEAEMQDEINVFLHEVPRRAREEAPMLAASLGCDPAVAEALVSDFVALVMGELGDLSGEAARAVERAIEPPGR